MSRPHLILGTAGHIDHGKTTLIRALTGVDCDRLPEEKARGITIELGFAPLDLPSGTRLGIVDVPGHEKLVRTMVAGATGVDLVLFVVAADEGLMPQSREHLAVCELLGISRGVVALTKTDVVDPELAELARLEIEEELAASSFAGAPIIPVSAHTREGLDELLAALEAQVAAAAPATLRGGPAWLPVDRAFTMKGFGTVVTGTLRGAPLEEGASVAVWPDPPGDVVTTRLRGVQVHGQATAKAEPGSRCALNLQGLDLTAVPRGSVVGTPGRLDYRRRVDIELALVPQSPPVASGSRFTVHVGTSERIARLRLLDRDRLEPGERAFAELRFEQPLVAVEGEPCILRGYRRLPGAGWTVGGGRILDPEPARRRQQAAQRLEGLEAMASGDTRASLAARLRRAGPAGVAREELARAARELEGLEGVRTQGDRWLDPDAFSALVASCVEAVRAHHAERPGDDWVGLAHVTARLGARVPDDTVRAALAAAAESETLASSGSGYRLPEHAAHVADPELAARVLARLESAGLAPDDQTALATALGCAPKRLRPVLDFLTAEGKLCRVASGLYFAAGPIADLRARLVAHLEAHQEVDPKAYKTLTGQTRKFTVPLMEFFDAQKVTRRRGNVRVLRGGA